MINKISNEQYEPVKDGRDRELDSSKIDWKCHGHTHFSMLKVGVYPDGTTQKQVLEKVKGTFGGRFTKFGDGRFEYIAHTD